MKIKPLLKKGLILKLPIASLILFTILAGYQSVSGNTGGFEKQRITFLQTYLRTELYFGTDKPDGAAVTEEEWTRFLAEEVTARFPDGFTVLEGYGQFRN